MPFTVQNQIVIDDSRNVLNISNATFVGTSHIKVPTGTISQRPLVPENGMIRYNTINAALEGYSQGQWGKLLEVAYTLPSTNTLLGPLQVVTATKTSSQTTTSANTLIAITDLSSNITPSNTSSKIKISASINVTSATFDMHRSSVEVILFRNSTKISSKIFTLTFNALTVTGSYGSGGNLSFNVLDQPNTTSPVNYNFSFKYLPDLTYSPNVTADIAGINYTINNLSVTLANVVSEMTLEEYQ